MFRDAVANAVLNGTFSSVALTMQSAVRRAINDFIAARDAWQVNCRVASAGASNERCLRSTCHKKPPAYGTRLIMWSRCAGSEAGRQSGRSGGDQCVPAAAVLARHAVWQPGSPEPRADARRRCRAVSHLRSSLQPSACCCIGTQGVCRRSQVSIEYPKDDILRDCQHPVRSGWYYSNETHAQASSRGCRDRQQSLVRPSAGVLLLDTACHMCVRDPPLLNRFTACAWATCFQCVRPHVSSLLTDGELAHGAALCTAEVCVKLAVCNGLRGLFGEHIKVY